MIIQNNLLFLLLMSVFPESFLTLMRRHLMSFPLLSAWHNVLFYLVFNFWHKCFGWFKRWDIVRRNDKRSISWNITSCFFSPFLYYKTSKTSQINIFTIHQRIFYCFHKCFYSFLHSQLFNSCVLRNFINDVCLCHFLKYLVFNYLIG